MALMRFSLPRPKVADEGHRVTTFELLFDLVFVFAFTQVTGLMAHAHSPIGVLQAVIIIGILWWSWSSYGWLANQTHVDEGVMRVGMSVAMAAMFVVALVIPEAFDDLEGGLSGPLVLALAYFVVRLIHVGLYLLAAGEDKPLRRQVLRTSVAMIVGVGLITAGAIIGGPFQVWLWLAGLLADMILTYVTSSGGNWRLQSPAHWAERHGLVVILVLGESIVAIGVGAAQEPVSVPIIAGAALAIALTISLWWLYFDAIAIAAEHHLQQATGVARAQLATDGYTYLHFLLIVGVLISALGVEEVIAHATDPGGMGLFTAVALLGGPSLYLAGHAFFWRRAGGAWKLWQLGAATLLLALIPLGALIPPLLGLVAVVILVAAIALIESVRNAEGREAVRSGSRHPGKNRAPAGGPRSDV
jgi:low temperature requirement protein LtrA